MKLVEIFVDQTAIDAQLKEIESKTALLQSVYDDLCKLDVTNSSLGDIQAIAGNAVSDSTLKALVARGKSIKASGAVVNINPENILLDARVVQSLKQKLRLLSALDYTFYELREGVIKVKSEARARIEPGHIIWGTQKAAEVIALVESDLVPAINAALAIIRPGDHSPFRDPMSLLNWDGETKTFSVDRITIAQGIQ